MAGFDKDETLGFIAAAKEVFMRFGSTRLLALFVELIFLYGVSVLDPQRSKWYAALAVVLSLLTLLSFHTKPHLDRVK